eukprot:2876572-Karenia_brevis.AAC.1
MLGGTAVVGRVARLRPIRQSGFLGRNMPGRTAVVGRVVGLGSMRQSGHLGRNMPGGTAAWIQKRFSFGGASAIAL